MKTLLSTLAVAALLVTAIPPARGQEPVSVELFYETLSPHGDWLDAGDYGYVWQPYDVGNDWQPYSDGRWIYTDAGWTWDSAEPYGWAVYHYGRWAEMQDVGWVWVPGTEWGPGWVSWRRSPEYVGWAPLPPEAQFTSTIGISSWADDYYDIGPGHYRFVEGRNFGAPRLNSVFVDRSQNLTIINQTTNITNITYRDNVVYNGGLDYDEQMRRSSEPISRYRLDRRRDFDGNRGRDDDGYFRSRVDGDSYSVAAPQMRAGNGGRPAKLARTVNDAQVNRGWREVGNPEEVARTRAKMKSDAPAPANAPKRAEIATRPGRLVADDKGGNPDRPGPGGDRNKGNNNNGNNETGMRNRPPEPGAPRPNRETPGKGMADKGNDRPAPGNQAKEKEKETGAKPGDPPRPASRMREDAPGNGNGGKGGNNGKGNAEKENRPGNPEAAPRPNRMPVEAPPSGNGGNGGKGKAENENRPGNPGAGGNGNGNRPGAERPSPNRMPVEAPPSGNGGNGGNGGKGKAENENRPGNPGAGGNGNGNRPQADRPSPNREAGEKGAGPERPAPAQAPANRPAANPERMQPEARTPAPRTPQGGAGNNTPGRPAAEGNARPGKGNGRAAEAEREKEKEKGRPGN